MASGVSVQVSGQMSAVADTRHLKPIYSFNTKASNILY